MMSIKLRSSNNNVNIATASAVHRDQLTGSDEIPHRTAPDPPKLGERSPQPGKTMGSPGTLPLMGGHP